MTRYSPPNDTRIPSQAAQWIRSIRRTALRRATNRGDVERMREVFEAEVRLTPWMNMIWYRALPMIPTAASFSKSPRSKRSRSLEPAIRTRKSTDVRMRRSPLKPPGVMSRRASLIRMKLSPHITTAASMRASLAPKPGPLPLEERGGDAVIGMCGAPGTPPAGGTRAPRLISPPGGSGGSAPR